ncbi:hypothetical protein [Streptomyces sp. NRRL WC-3742]|nr:hypothetical protein [Streptomyces sp. NRRL WC-3742]
MTVTVTAAVAGLAGARTRAAELAFVLLLIGCAVGAMALLGAWGRRRR